MPLSLPRLYRRARYGKPVIVVSGLPRSGTSMMMQMLEAGGLEILTDRIRAADESNPQGYYELERVKELDKGGDPSWLEDARGKAVKIIAFHLEYLPDHLNYRVIFMRRDLDEVLASQAMMLEQRGEVSGTDEERMRSLFERHLSKTRRLMAARACFDVIEVGHRDVLSDPTEQAARVSRFLGGKLEVQRMAAVVHADLYRQRREPTER